MIFNKSLDLIILTIFLVFTCGKCFSDPIENVKFITKSAQKLSEDWESDIFEPNILANEKDNLTASKLGDDIEYENDVKSDKILTSDDEKDNNDDNANKGYVKRIARQVNGGYFGIYPTLTPQNPQVPVYPAPYAPTAGLHQGNYPNYNANGNNYNSAYLQPYHNNTATRPVSSRPPYYPQSQNPFLNNTRYSYPGSTNNNQSFTNGFNSNSIRYPQYNQNSNQRFNSSLGQTNNYYINHPSVKNPNQTFPVSPPYGNNVNQHKFTPTPGYQTGYQNNNSHYSPSGGLTSNGYPQYPNFNNNSNITPRAVLNGPSNPLNPPYQGYPLYSNTHSQNNLNRSNQWSSSFNSQSPYNQTGNKYPAYTPTDRRSSNYSHQNYPTNNYNSYPTQQPYSPNPSPNAYSQYYPLGPNANQNNQYNKEPEHFFFAPNNRESRNTYDPRINPTPSFSYSP